MIRVGRIPPREEPPTERLRSVAALALSSECCGFARDSAKVEDQVRFLARTLELTLEPDGTATACKAV